MNKIVSTLLFAVLFCFDSILPPKDRLPYLSALNYIKQEIENEKLSEVQILDQWRCGYYYDFWKDVHKNKLPNYTEKYVRDSLSKLDEQYMYSCKETIGKKLPRYILKKEQESEYVVMFSKMHNNTIFVALGKSKRYSNAKYEDLEPGERKIYMFSFNSNGSIQDVYTSYFIAEP